MYTPTTEQLERITKKDFVYHKPKEGQAERYSDIRRRFSELAVMLCSECPQSRELSIAMTKLEESVMWANAAIARNE